MVELNFKESFKILKHLNVFKVLYVNLYKSLWK